MTYNSKYVITDSGGIQEETSILNIPCYTLRNTEQPITLIDNHGTNQLITNIKDIHYDIQQKYIHSISLWDGDASKRILHINNFPLNLLYIYVIINYK